VLFERWFHLTDAVKVKMFYLMFHRISMIVLIFQIFSIKTSF
jgi:hypothetical protein